MDGPTVVVLCNGDTDSAESVVLPSEKKGRVITQVLSEYKGGGACREGATTRNVPKLFSQVEPKTAS